MVIQCLLVNQSLPGLALVFWLVGQERDRVWLCQ